MIFIFLAEKDPTRASFETHARRIEEIFDYNYCMYASRLSALTIVFSLVLCGIVALHPTHADVYKYIDGNGHMYLTDKPKHSGYRLVLKSREERPEPRIDYQNMETNRQRFALSIEAVARSHDLPEGLIHAVIAIESAYDPDAVSRSGAVGLMQLMPETARRYGVTNRRDPAANLSGGTRYLKDLLERFGNNLELALAGYNAGENAVKKYGNQVPPFSETQSYIRKVIKLYEQYPGVSASDT